MRKQNNHLLRFIFTTFFAFSICFSTDIVAAEGNPSQPPQEPWVIQYGSTESNTSFFERHKKKLIAGAIVAGALVACWWFARSAKDGERVDTRPQAVTPHTTTPAPVPAVVQQPEDEKPGEEEGDQSDVEVEERGEESKDDGVEEERCFTFDEADDIIEEIQSVYANQLQGEQRPKFSKPLFIQSRGLSEKDLKRKIVEQLKSDTTEHHVFIYTNEEGETEEIVFHDSMVQASKMLSAKIRFSPGKDEYVLEDVASPWLLFFLLGMAAKREALSEENIESRIEFFDTTIDLFTDKRFSCNYLWDTEFYPKFWEAVDYCDYRLIDSDTFTEYLAHIYLLSFHDGRFPHPLPLPPPGPEHIRFKQKLVSHYDKMLEVAEKLSKEDKRWGILDRKAMGCTRQEYYKRRFTELPQKFGEIYNQLKRELESVSF